MRLSIVRSAKADCRKPLHLKPSPKKEIVSIGLQALFLSFLRQDYPQGNLLTVRSYYLSDNIKKAEQSSLPA
jgi:hypothetical protein